MRVFPLILLVVAAQAAVGQTAPILLSPDDAAAGDRTGLAVAVSAGRALVGAPYDDGPALNAGVVYVFERQRDGTWTRSAELAASDAAAQSVFGIAVALDGDRALVGALPNEAAGAAYVFERAPGGTWTQAAKFQPPAGATGDRFGYAVALDGARALVGARGENGETGAAYVFDRQPDGTWAQAARLVAADGAAVDAFGWSVSVSGDRVLVGSPADDGRDVDDGSAYVFDRRGDGAWVQTAKLVPPDGGGRVEFGRAVVLDGPLALVGAPRDNERGAGAGAVYVYERGAGGAWSRSAKIVAPRGGIGLFGTNVALDGDLLVVGAPQDRGGTENGAGAAYVYERESGGTWVAGPVLASPRPRFGDYFGYRVAVSDGTAVVGAFAVDVGVVVGSEREDAGAAYAYALRAPSVAVDDGPEAASAVRVWPNPAAGPVRVSFGLTGGADVRVAVYDLLGREVAVLADGRYGQGRHGVDWSASRLPAGVYVVRAVVGGEARTTRVTVVR